MYAWDWVITICFPAFTVLDGCTDLGKIIYPVLVLVALPVLLILEPYPYDDEETVQRMAQS